MRTWGDKPVLLLGIGLGIEGIDPIYFNTIKVFFVLLFICFFNRFTAETLRVSPVRGRHRRSSRIVILFRRRQSFYLDPHHADQPP